MDSVIEYSEFEPWLYSLLFLRYVQAILKTRVLKAIQLNKNNKKNWQMPVGFLSTWASRMLILNLEIFEVQWGSEYQKISTREANPLNTFYTLDRYKIKCLNC